MTSKNDFTGIRNPKQYEGQFVAFIPSNRPVLGCQVIAKAHSIGELMAKLEGETRAFNIHRF